MKFIDLFAGIGGFHQAMKKFNGQCVLSSEIDPHCLDTYKKNYNIEPNNDIRKIDTKDVPNHDILLGGFPCQAFSKAGSRKGIEDTRGTLFFEIARILEYKKPKYVLLENVKNIVTHDKGNTWKIIQETLSNLGYVTTKKPLLLSPHEFGVPQLRERAFIPAVRKDIIKEKNIEMTFDNNFKKDDNKIIDIFKKEDNIDFDTFKITKIEEEVLDAWNEFKKNVITETFGFPIWIDHFKTSDNEVSKMPIWKQKIVNKNRELYLKNSSFIENWLNKNYKSLNDKATFRKFEWQAGNDINDIYEGLIQIRPSGIRVKRPNVAQTLVAMVQIPIYGPLKRRFTPRECARLQSFPEDFILNENNQQAYKQFGNSVNVTVIEKILEELFKYK